MESKVLDKNGLSMNVVQTSQLETLNSTFFKRSEMDQHLTEFGQLQGVVQEQATKIQQLENATRTEEGPCQVKLFLFIFV